MGHHFAKYDPDYPAWIYRLKADLATRVLGLVALRSIRLAPGYQGEDAHEAERRHAIMINADYVQNGGLNCRLIIRTFRLIGVLIRCLESVYLGGKW